MTRVSHPPACSGRRWSPSARRSSVLRPPARGWRCGGRRRSPEKQAELLCSCCSICGLTFRACVGVCTCACVRACVRTDTSRSPFLSSPQRSAGPPARMKEMKIPSPSSPPTMLKPSPVAPRCSTTFLGSLHNHTALKSTSHQKLLRHARGAAAGHYSRSACFQKHPRSTKPLKPLWKNMLLYFIYFHLSMYVCMYQVSI